MPANLFALAAGGVASLIMGDWVPLAAAGGASAAYLAFPLFFLGISYITNREGTEMLLHSIPGQVIMLFIIAVDMVFERRTERRQDRAERIRATPEVEDVSVFPMAMPMIAGPGSIASVMLLVAQSDGLPRALVIFGALLLVLLLTLAALLLAAPMMKIIGAKAETVVTRLLGVLLAALAAQFVIDGLKASFVSL